MLYLHLKTIIFKILKTEIHILRAYHGDCLLIKTFDEKDSPFNILIDGGPPNSFDFSLRKQLKGIKVINLLILTHIDYDHIGGIIKFLNNSLFDEIQIDKYWINCKNLIDAGVNSGKISYAHAKNLEELFIEKKVPLEKFENFVTTDFIPKLVNGIKITVLSPEPEIIEKLNSKWKDLNESHQEKLEGVKISGNVKSQITKGSLLDLSKEKFRPQNNIDNDIINSSSIALIIEGRDFKFLSLADSRAEIIEKSLKKLLYNDGDNKLKVDYMQISHHGSKNNTSNELLDLVDCSNFIICTNGGSGRSKHPDREVIARILYHPKREKKDTINLIFNYPLNEIQANSGLIFTEEELNAGNCKYTDNKNKLPLDYA